MIQRVGAPTNGALTEYRDCSHQQGRSMRTVRLSHIAATAGAMMSLIGLILSACVPAQQYDALENDYNQLNQRLSSEIGAQQVHITRLQGAIKVAVNSELLFPSGLADASLGGADDLKNGPNPCAVPADHDN